MNMKDRKFDDYEKTRCSRSPSRDCPFLSISSMSGRFSCKLYQQPLYDFKNRDGSTVITRCTDCLQNKKAKKIQKSPKKVAAKEEKQRKHHEWVEFVNSIGKPKKMKWAWSEDGRWLIDQETGEQILRIHTMFQVSPEHAKIIAEAGGEISNKFLKDK